LFFERFREAVARLPAGLIRCGPAATRAALTAVEASLGKRLPPAFASFLLSFDGADLFHEAVIVAGLGDQAPRRLQELNPDRDNAQLIFAEAGAGDRFAFADGDGVWLIRAGSDERWLAGSDFTRWLDALVAHEKPLYGPDGEFSPDAFEPDGAEVVPRVALKQAERASKADPDAALWHHERGVALRRLDRGADAKLAFARAAALDPGNPWAAFDHGRAALAIGAGGAREALGAFQAAARLESGPASARLWMWAARAAWAAALPEQVASCRREALACNPEIGDELRRAVQAAAGEAEPDATAEAQALLVALEDPIPTARSRLPVVDGDGDSDRPRRARR
jgi:tetratricopeptide (TPR) repeat protein